MSVKHIPHFSILALALLFSGCAEHALQITPHFEKNNEGIAPLGCTIVYEHGNYEYVPSMITHNPTAKCTALYAYQIQYHNGGTSWDGLNIWNPLLFVGFPMSEESLVVEAKLALKENNTLIKEFSAVCIANKTRNLFQNAGSSGPRKACLLEIKDNIDSQIKHFKKESKYE